MNNKEFSSNSDLKFGKSSNFRSSANDKLGLFARSFFDSIQVIVVALSVVVLVYIFIASFNIVDGESMLPNFEPRDLIISEKITTNWGNLQRGDVIVFQASPGKDFIKRIIGLPGDKVKVEGGKVYVNGTPLKEDYLTEENQNVGPGNILQEGLEVTSPPDEYIVMGDNRKNSLDSRNIGPVDKSKIKAKAWLVFWPLNKFHIVQHVRYPELGDK